MNPDIRAELDERRDKLVKDMRAILYDYYKRSKYMCNEDARGAVDSHFNYPESEVVKDLFERTKHWNDLNNER